MRCFPAAWTGILLYFHLCVAYPGYGKVRSRQEVAGRIIEFPDPDPDNGLKQIPDADHPYIAPGPGDMRGPCPALNTLANHGYLPRNGIAMPEQIFMAVTEGFNLGPTFAKFLISFATLARGNAYTGMLSIGGISPDIPALPGWIDGPGPPGGIAKHDRFEGDFSMSRNDADIGDQVNFQADLFDMLFGYVDQFGDEDEFGQRTIVTQAAMAEFKTAHFQMYQAEDPGFTLHLARQLTVFSEVSLVLNAFANGDTRNLTTSDVTTIFQDQTFPPNFYRHATPLELDAVSATAGAVMTAIGNLDPLMRPGENIDGQYVADEPVFTNFLCDAIIDIFTNNIPSSLVDTSLVDTTGILQQNVDYLTAAMFRPFAEVAGCSVMPAAAGPTGI